VKQFFFALSVIISVVFNKTFSQIVYDYSYTGTVQSVTLDPGNYRLEVWGAQGGDGKPYSSSYYALGGAGGYSKGELS